MQVDDNQRYLMITEAAYFLAERRGFVPGHEHEDWLAAERQVNEMLKTMEQKPALEQRIEAGELMNPAYGADLAAPAERTTTTLAETSSRDQQTLTQGRQITEGNQVTAMQATFKAEANEQATPARKATPAKAKAPSRPTTVKLRSTTGGRKATAAKQSVAAGTIPSERMPQPTSATSEQPVVKAKAPAQRPRRSTKTDQATPMAAASQEGSKSARKPRQKKAEAITAKGDGRRRSKATSV